MLNWLGLSDKTLPLVVAGALGGVVRWLTLRDHWSDGIISIVVGAICALYASPLVLPALTPMLGAIQIPPESVSGLSGFLIGVGGISISSLFISIIRDRTGFLQRQRKPLDAPQPSADDDSVQSMRGMMAQPKKKAGDE